VAGDDNLIYDSFVHDFSSGKTIRISRAPNDQAISGDGRFVVVDEFDSSVIGSSIPIYVFRYEITTGARELASVTNAGVPANAPSVNNVAINRDGSAVAFASIASNLAAPDSLGWTDVFVHRFNTAPTSNAGLDQTVECASSGGASVP
jgi:hypothetical protein